jgi:hypothetical protein
VQRGVANCDAAMASASSTPRGGGMSELLAGTRRRGASGTAVPRASCAARAADQISEPGRGPASRGHRRR